MVWWHVDNFSWVLHEVDFNPSITQSQRYCRDLCRRATLLCQGWVNICRTTCPRLREDMWNVSILREHDAARFAEWNGQERKWLSTNKGCVWASAFHAPPRNVAAHSHSPNLKHSYNDKNCNLLSFALSLSVNFHFSSSASVHGSAFLGDPGSFKHFKQLTQDRSLSHRALFPKGTHSAVLREVWRTPKPVLLRAVMNPFGWMIPCPAIWEKRKTASYDVSVHWSQNTICSWISLQAVTNKWIPQVRIKQHQQNHDHITSHQPFCQSKKSLPTRGLARSTFF